MTRASRSLPALPALPALLASTLLLTTACGERDEVWDKAPSNVQAFGLTDRVIMIDDTASRAVVLTPEAEQRLGTASLALGKNVASAALAKARDRLFVLSYGDLPRRSAEDERPSLTAIDSAGARRFELSSPHGGLVADPQGRYLAIFAAAPGTSGTRSAPASFVENPNEILLVDLASPPGQVPIVPRSIRSFGGRPKNVSFTPVLNLPGGPRRLLVVETEQDITLLDLDHIHDKPERPEITVRLSGGVTAKALVPAGVVVDDGEPGRSDDSRIAVRLANDTSVVLLTLGPSAPGSPNDFLPALNLADVGGPAQDIAFVKTDGGARIAALVPSTRSAVLIEPNTGLTQKVDLPDAYSRLALITGEVGGGGGLRRGPPVRRDQRGLRGLVLVPGADHWTALSKYRGRTSGDGGPGPRGRPPSSRGAEDPGERQRRGLLRAQPGHADGVAAVHLGQAQAPCLCRRAEALGVPGGGLRDLSHRSGDAPPGQPSPRSRGVGGVRRGEPLGRALRDRARRSRYERGHRARRRGGGLRGRSYLLRTSPGEPAVKRASLLLVLVSLVSPRMGLADEPPPPPVAPATPSAATPSAITPFTPAPRAAYPALSQAEPIEADSVPEKPVKPYSWFRFGLGARIGYIPNEGLDPFAKNDVLAQVSIDVSRTLMASGRTSFALGLGWDGVTRGSVTARGQGAELTVHRLSVPLEGRYHITPWLYGFGRVAPGAGILIARVNDAAAPTTLGSTRGVFSLDASAGASFLLIGHGPPDRRRFRLWATHELGYGWTSSASFALGTNSRDEVLGIEEPARLGEIALRGFFFRLGIAATY